MPINKKNVEILKAKMRKHADRYNQNNFGSNFSLNECGTTMCVAGFCRVEEVGLKQFKKEIRQDGDKVDLEDLCITSGKKLLGLKTKEQPQIFGDISEWPDDLSFKYKAAKTYKERTEVACAALDRLKVDGSIREI
jgi:hypothetical protein